MIRFSWYIIGSKWLIKAWGWIPIFLNMFGTFPYLISLSLVGNGIEDLAVDAFTGLPNLRHLSLQRNKIEVPTDTDEPDQTQENREEDENMENQE